MGSHREAKYQGYMNGTQEDEQQQQQQKIVRKHIQGKSL